MEYHEMKGGDISPAKQAYDKVKNKLVAVIINNPKEFQQLLNIFLTPVVNTVLNNEFLELIKKSMTLDKNKIYLFLEKNNKSLQIIYENFVSQIKHKTIVLPQSFTPFNVPANYIKDKLIDSFTLDEFLDNLSKIIINMQHNLVDSKHMTKDEIANQIVKYISDMLTYRIKI
jgi:hypothetical protein